MCLRTFKWIYTYDLQVNSWLVVLFLNALEFIGLHTSIAIVSTQLNSFNIGKTYHTIQYLFRDVITRIAI